MFAMLQPKVLVLWSIWMDTPAAALMAARAWPPLPIRYATHFCSITSVPVGRSGGPRGIWPVERIRSNPASSTCPARSTAAARASGEASGTPKRFVGPPSGLTCWWPPPGSAGRDGCATTPVLEKPPPAACCGCGACCCGWSASQPPPLLLLRGLGLRRRGDGRFLRLGERRGLPPLWPWCAGGAWAGSGGGSRTVGSGR
mmetsp:Transcript_91969/g.239749  ORF Transcript_91969/g.239749 Transcript_91969/m.239749 type:complete len:200 (-) Transcript_91969:252-851(-)